MTRAAGDVGVPARPGAVPCRVMRGGTSKGLYFLASDLPTDAAVRDDLLLRIMGSPDDRQIDGMGGAHPLTSKVAVVSPSARPDADVDYLFLQVVVDRPVVTDRQNCGNLLAGVGPFAIDRGLVPAPADGDPEGIQYIQVRIHLVNTGGVAVATVPVRDGLVVEAGGTSIAGVPGTAAPIRLDFVDTAGSSCGSLLPTGNVVDEVEGVPVTLIDNGMPVVVLRADAVGVSGYESPDELEADTALRSSLEAIRLAAGPLMNLGDVAAATVPKLTLVAPPRDGGAVSTRTFIPHRCHDAIGVLGAVSVATAVGLDGSIAADVAARPAAGAPVVVEHPTGTMDAVVELSFAGGGVDVSLDGSLADGQPVVGRSGIVRTARTLMDGWVWPRQTTDVLTGDVLTTVLPADVLECA